MKIVHVIESAEIGGAETLVASLAGLQRSLGHEVTVHCLFRSGPLAERMRESGVLVHVHAPRYAHRNAKKLALLRAMHRVFRADRPDAVHCHNITATMLAAPPARMLNVGAIISTRHGLMPPPRPWKPEFLYRLAARSCDRIVAVSETMRRDLAASLPGFAKKIITVRNCAAPARGSAVPAQPRKSGFQLVTVSRLAPPKDHATLLRAVKLASTEAPDVVLHIVGDGVDGPALRKLNAELGLGDRVFFLGERDDVGAWLKQAQVFVLSSLSEGVPMALLEALSAGLPLLITDVGGMPEIARLSGVAVIVPPGQPEALAAAIVGYSKRRSELPELSLRACQCYQENFLPERMAQAYLDLYRECQAERHGRAAAPCPAQDHKSTCS